MKKKRVGEDRGRWISGNRKGEIILYKAGTAGPCLEVHLEEDTVWLSLGQMVDLFGRDKSVISRHLHNIFRDKELRRTSVVALFATTAADGKVYQVEYYNLDAIISVGYRVNSKRGTQFRTWATKILKEHIVKGYTENRARLRELQQSLRLVGNVLDRYDVSSEEARALLRVVTDYSYALDQARGNRLLFVKNPIRQARPIPAERFC